MLWPFHKQWHSAVGMATIAELKQHMNKYRISSSLILQELQALPEKQEHHIALPMVTLLCMFLVKTM